MKIKAFAFDMDGTILRSNGKGIHPETIKAIEEAQKAGFMFILATGRPFVQTIPIAEEIGCFSYLICNNGANVYDVKNKIFLNKNSISVEAFERVIMEGQRTKSFFALHTKNNVYRYYFCNTKENRPVWLNESLHENTTPQTLEEISRFAREENITQLSLKNSKEVIVATTARTTKFFGNSLSVHISNEVYMDVNPANTSKLTGLKLSLKHEDFGVESVMSFGDSGNDLQMIKGCGYGVSMGNGTKELKENATIVIGDNDSDAIAKKIWETIS